MCLQVVATKGPRKKHTFNDTEDVSSTKKPEKKREDCSGSALGHCSEKKPSSKCQFGDCAKYRQTVCGEFCCRHFANIGVQNSAILLLMRSGLEKQAITAQMQAVERCLVFHISFGANVGAAGDGTSWEEEDRMNETKGALMNNNSLQSPMVKLSKECNSKSYTQNGRSTNNKLDNKKKRSRKSSSCIFLAVCVCQCCEKFDVNIAKRPEIHWLVFT